MEEVWVRCKEILELRELATQEIRIKNTKKEYEEILKNEDFECKFKVEETSRYNGLGKRRKLIKVYVLSIYVRKQDLEKANKFFNKLNEKENKEREEEQKEIETEYKNLMPVKIEKYFTIVMILFFIVLEIVVMVKSYLEAPIIEILVVGILLVVSEIWIIYKVGSENKKKRR